MEPGPRRSLPVRRGSSATTTGSIKRPPGGVVVVGGAPQGPYLTLNHNNHQAGDQSSLPEQRGNHYRLSAAMLPYHDVVALHLRLLIGQFVVFHFQTRAEDNSCNTLFLDQSAKPAAFTPSLRLTCDTGLEGTEIHL